MRKNKLAAITFARGTAIEIRPIGTRTWMPAIYERAYTPTIHVVITRPRGRVSFTRLVTSSRIRVVRAATA